MNYHDLTKQYQAFCRGENKKERGKSGNISYNGYDFISYLTLVARYYPEQKLMLADSYRYSRTTESQLGLIYIDFRVPEIRVPAARCNVDYLKNAAVNELTRAMKATVWYGLIHFFTLSEQYYGFCKVLKIKANKKELNPTYILKGKLLERYVKLRLLGEI